MMMMKFVLLLSTSNIKTDNLGTMKHSGAFLQPLLQWKINKYYIFSLYICSLKVSGMQRTCSILSFVDDPALQYFSTLSHKRHNFNRKYY